MTYKRLEPTFKATWITHLRLPPELGGYHQGSGTLRRAEFFDGELTDSYCCLGVACDLLGKDLWEQEFHPYEVNVSDSGRKVWGRIKDYYLVDHFTKPEREYHARLMEQDIIPKDLADKIDLSAAAALALMDMNDTGKTFSEIADWIEVNL